MNPTRLLFTALSVTALFLSSCYGTKELAINTDPSGAAVTINGKPVPGTTPLVTEVEQDKDLGIVVQKPGYEVASTTLHTKSSMWLGLLWTQNDPWAQYIDEDEVNVKLKPIPSISTYRPSSLPPYTGGGGATSDRFNQPKTKASNSEAPKLKPMPTF